MSGPQREMHFMEHLEELRWAIIHSALGIAVGAAAGWVVSQQALEYIVRHTVGSVVVLSVMESFNERVRLSIILGMALALPYVLFRVWLFVVPGLFRKERRMVVPIMVSSLTLFFLGGAFAFFMVVPAIVRVMKTFLTPSMTQMLRLHDVLGFVYNLVLACGVLFQLPLVTLLLSWIGLVTPMFLLGKWRHAVVIILVLTAAITPGDVASAQLFLGIPIVGLYFLSVAVAFMVRRKPKPKPEEGTDAPGTSHA
jgi:sec-independent protein translocase protein TatC